MSEADPSRVLVLTAIPQERHAIAKRLAGKSVVVVATGDGPGNAARGAAAAIERHRPALLVGAGVAGALTPGLSVCDLVASARVLDARGEAPPPDRKLLEEALASAGVRAGTILTVVRPVVTAAEKIALAASTGAPAVCDMESAAWARAAAERGVPYVVLRAVSDTADEDLPRYLARCMNAEGGISRAMVALSALLDPTTIPELLRMRRRVAACGWTLGDALQEFVGAALAAGPNHRAGTSPAPTP